MVYCKINKIILNQIYKFFVYALQFDPPQPPPPLGPPHWGKRKGGEEKAKSFGVGLR